MCFSWVIESSGVGEEHFMIPLRVIMEGELTCTPLRGLNCGFHLNCCVAKTCGCDFSCLFLLAGFRSHSAFYPIGLLKKGCLLDRLCFYNSIFYCLSYVNCIIRGSWAPPSTWTYTCYSNDDTSSYLAYHAIKEKNYELDCQTQTLRDLSWALEEPLPFKQKVCGLHAEKGVGSSKMPLGTGESRKHYIPGFSLRIRTRCRGQ